MSREDCRELALIGLFVLIIILAAWLDLRKAWPGVLAWLRALLGG